MVGAVTPKTLKEALTIRAQDAFIPFAGGTDLMVKRRSWSGTLPNFDRPVLFIGGLEELQTISLSESLIRIGAAASLRSIADYAATPRVMKQAILEMASPAIRNTGTLGGNICNASPAADTLSPLYALNAVVLLQGASGNREVPIEKFITGPAQTILNDDELLVAVQIPVRSFETVYYRKVGTRKADALSKVSFAGLASVHDGVVNDIRVAMGAVAPKVVRDFEAERLIIGRNINEIPSLIEDLKAIYAKAIQPIDDQRSSAVYRRIVALRLVENFLRTIDI